MRQYFSMNRDKLAQKEKREMARFFANHCKNRDISQSLARFMRQYPSMNRDRLVCDVLNSSTLTFSFTECQDGIRAIGGA